MSSPEETTTAPETSGEAEAPEEAAPRDEVREQALADLRDELGDAVIDTYVRPGQASWARVSRDAWHEVAVVAKEKLGYDFFDFLSAIDWLPSPFGRDMNAQEDLQDEAESEAPAISAEPGAIERGYTGGETRFQLLASLYDTRRHLGILLKTDLPDDDLTAQSWSDVFWGADWHERETAEMFGIEFVGHPNLINIYLPTDFEGHPLRKDYPLLARRVKPWPGIVDVEPMPPSDEPAADDVPAGDGTDGGEDGGEASGGDES